MLKAKKTLSQLLVYHEKLLLIIQATASKMSSKLFHEMIIFTYLLVYVEIGHYKYFIFRTKIEEINIKSFENKLDNKINLLLI